MENKKILLIEPPTSNSSLLEKLKNWGYEPIPTKSHLYGLKILDDENPSMIITFFEETDINGIEFCKLVRFRERNGILDKKYIIMFVKEVSRALRINKVISILLLKLTDLEKIQTNYGDDWVRWLENLYIELLKPKIRTFEGIGKIGDSVYCIITLGSIKDLKGFAKRIKKEHQSILKEHKFLKDLSSFDIKVSGINFLLEFTPGQIEKNINLIMKFLQNSAESEDWEEAFISVKITDEGITLIDQ